MAVQAVPRVPPSRPLASPRVPTGVGTGGVTTTNCPNGIFRCFTYSSLSRLTSATNPESGTVTYSTYDGNGNLKQFTDAQGVVTNLTYDLLNRPLTKTYTLPSGCAAQCTASTNSVGYTYDQGGFRGALSSISSGAVTQSYGYDPYGRLTSSVQNMGSGTSYSFGYTYSLTDQLANLTYPSGRVVQYSLDAVDRVQTVKNVGTGSNYATINYTTSPSNTLTLTLGNGVTEQPSFNDRLQPIGLQVNSGSLLSLGLYPCAGPATSCASGNVGNLQAQTITIPGFSATQNYTYDNLNRLTSAAEGTSWNQSYMYVGNGNRYVSSNGGTTTLPITPETPQAASAYSSSNRINTWTYDNNGNIWTIPLVGNTSRSFTYDAENRTLSATIVTGTGTTSASYVYDGLGQRVSKTVNGQTTTFVYNAFGNLMAEYGGTGTSPCDTATCYLTVDHLGSTRLITDTAGLNGTASSTVVRYDYQPFGGEITANYGNRTNAMGYLTAPDATGPKYTGKYRDPETTMDWFEVRHMSGAQGRFQSVDPGNAGANAADPQTWNAYAYVGNNPLSYTDPSGMGGGEGAGIGAAICGPICAGVGAAVEIGITLWEIFGGGSSHTALGPVTNNTSEPWSEQIPYNLGGGGTNIGGVYGDGNTGPFVFSILRAGGSPADMAQYERAIAYLMRDPGMALIIGQLRKSKKVYTVKFIGGGDDRFRPAAGEVLWDPTSSLRTRGGGCQSPALGLGHEFAHAYEFDLYPYWYAKQARTPAGDYENQVEKWAITGPETSAARTLGEAIRRDHIFGDLHVEPSATSKTCR